VRKRWEESSELKLQIMTLYDLRKVDLKTIKMVTTPLNAIPLICSGSLNLERDIGGRH